MQRSGLASFVSGAGLYLVFVSHFRLGEPLHPQNIFATKLARQHRERAVAGTITHISRREESLLMSGICATHHPCPARARWGQDDRSVAHLAEYIRGGAPRIGIYLGRHSAVCCRATGHQSPHSSFSLGPLGAGQFLEWGGVLLKVLLNVLRPSILIVIFLLPIILLCTRFLA
jgi:hypothetical protein